MSRLGPDWVGPGIFHTTSQIAAVSFLLAVLIAMAVFVLVAGIYFAMSYPLSIAVRYMERRLNISR